MHFWTMCTYTFRTSEVLQIFWILKWDHKGVKYLGRLRTLRFSLSNSFFFLCTKVSRQNRTQLTPMPMLICVNYDAGHIPFSFASRRKMQWNNNGTRSSPETPDEEPSFWISDCKGIPAEWLSAGSFPGPNDTFTVNVIDETMSSVRKYNHVLARLVPLRVMEHLLCSA